MKPFMCRPYINCIFYLMLLLSTPVWIWSFHVKSSDFWPFFHGPPPILLKFGTLVHRNCLETNIRQICFYLGEANSEI